MLFLHYVARCLVCHQVITDMNTLQQLLTRPCNIRVHVAAPVGRLVKLGVAPNVVWEKEFLPEDVEKGGDRYVFSHFCLLPSQSSSGFWPYPLSPGLAISALVCLDFSFRLPPFAISFSWRHLYLSFVHGRTISTSSL